jgi:hypothetical protein
MTVQPTDFAGYFEAEVAAARQASVDELGAEALAWLVLPPVWTDELADAASFPAKPLDRETFLAKCEELGWCVRRLPTGVTSRREEAAEILLELLQTLHSDPPESGIWRQVVSAAASVIEQIQVRALQQSLRNRLTELTAGSKHAAPAYDAAPSLPAQADLTDLAGQLIAQHAWRELDVLLKEIGPADLQRTILRQVLDLPPALLEPAVRRTAVECTPRAAARVLAAAAPVLPPTAVGRLISLVLPRFHLAERGAEAAVANLAIAASYAGDPDLALELSDQLSDDLLRAQALAVLAGALAAGPDHARTRDVVDRIARVIMEGEGVDLEGAADAVARLASADAVTAAAPIITVARKRLPLSHLSATDVGALVKLATALREAGPGAAADMATFVEAAVETAQSLGDPATRAAGLARVLPVVDDAHREALLNEALSAARDVADATERARSLVRLVGHLADAQLQPVVAELLSSVPPVDPGSAFWMPESARADILAELEQQKGLSWLRVTAATVGRAVLALNKPSLVPSALLRWAVLAVTLEGQRDVGDKTGDVLLQRVDPLLRSGYTAEALGWIETGRRLLSIIDGTFDTSLLVAARRVELVQRTVDDRRLLERFLLRHEEVAAFRDLLRTPDGEEPWALHYLGTGGVGKTMLLRHIAAELAPAEHLIIARVDFDHLNPDFPLRRPGQLLLDMLEELEAYADSDTRGLYEEARLSLRYQEWWREDTGAAPSIASAPPTIEHAIERFCSYLLALGGRIVLVLDTCEELAKFEPTGAVLPQLDAAFRLLEYVNRKVPSIRVVFAGRRPLARQVHGGRTLDPRRSIDRLPAEKTYVQVHEIAGFTEAEARTYLSDMEGLTLEEAAVRDLLDRSHSNPYEPFYPGGSAEVGVTRYVPFDLAQYAAALRDNPRHLRSAPRSLTYVTYVRDRVVGRQGPLTTRLLPAVVAMRRFDRDMLAVAVQDTTVTWEEAWQELTATEWIAAHVDTTLRTTFLEVDRTMLERLEAYYKADDQRAAYVRARGQVAAGLAQLVSTWPLTDLAVEHVDAALRCLLPEQPEQAAALCDDLALRVAADGDAWMWAYNVFSRVLGLDGALGDTAHPAAASARALHATALSQVRPAEDLQSQWHAIELAAEKHPRPRIGRWLAARAAVLAAPHDTGRSLRAMRLLEELLLGDEEQRRLAAWLVGTILAAATHVVDQAASDRRQPAIAAQWVLRDTIAHRFGPQVSAVAAVLLARGLVLHGDKDGAASLFSQALASAEVDPSGLRSAAEVAADGAVPANLRDRVRLEAALTDFPGVRGDEWLSQAVAAIQESTDAGRTADPDSDRLAALLLSRLLDGRLLPANELMRIQSAVGGLAPPFARTLAHHQVPPLRVILSRGWLALGDADRARAALGPRGVFAETAAEQRMLDLARVDIARRLRLPQSDPAVRSKLREACSPMEEPRVYEAMWLLGEGSPPPPNPASPPVHLHAWWRVEANPLRAVPVEQLARAFRVAPSWCAADQPYVRDALLLDEAELDQLAQSEPPESDQAIAALPIAEWYQQHQDLQQEAWRLLLRKAALVTRQKASPLLSGSVATPELPGVPPLGLRRLAELALEEGELLSLRLPELGAHLLRVATRWFRETDDHAGMLIAHITEMLAVARSTRTAPDVTDLEDSYLAARRRFTELPDWSELREDDSYAEAVSAMPRDARLAWEGWLLRLRWLLKGSSLARRELNPRTTAIPPELRVREPEDSADRTPSAPRAESVTPRKATEQLTAAYAARRRARRRLTGQTILAGAAVFAAAAAVVLIYVVFADTVGNLPVLRVAALRICSYIAALIGIAWVVSLVANSGPKNSRAVVTVDPCQDAAIVCIGLTALRGRWWPLPSRRSHTQEQVKMLGPARPDPARTSVHGLLRATTHPGRPLPVSLNVAQPLVGVAWEAWLAAPLDGSALYLGRPYPSLLGAVTEPRHDDPHYWVLAPPRWRSLVGSAISPDEVEFPARFPSITPGDVLIVVAIAVDTTAGRRLVIHGGASRHYDIVIDPDEASLTDLAVVVVGEPHGENRRASAAQSAAALRVCAADLIQAGARTVIVVPSAPAAAASDVLASLARILRSGDYQSAKGLSAGAAQARQILAEKTDTQLGYELTVMSRILS